MYRLNIPRNALNELLDQVAADQKVESLNYYCSQPAFEPLRKIGVSFEYYYSDSNNQHLYSVFLHPSEYEDTTQRFDQNEVHRSPKIIRRRE